MPRPVEGFCTADGTFFEDEDDAVIHECTYVLSNQLEKFAKERDSDIVPEAREALITYGLQFITENAKTVQDYLAAKRSKHSESKEDRPDQDAKRVDGPITEGMS